MLLKNNKELIELVEWWQFIILKGSSILKIFICDRLAVVNVTYRIYMEEEDKSGGTGCLLRRTEKRSNYLRNFIFYSLYFHFQYTLFNI